MILPAPGLRGSRPTPVPVVTALATFFQGRGDRGLGRRTGHGEPSALGLEVDPGPDRRRLDGPLLVAVGDDDVADHPLGGAPSRPSPRAVAMFAAGSPVIAARARRPQTAHRGGVRPRARRRAAPASSKVTAGLRRRRVRSRRSLIVNRCCPPADARAALRPRSTAAAAGRPRRAPGAVRVTPPFLARTDLGAVHAQRGCPTRPADQRRIDHRRDIGASSELAVRDGDVAGGRLDRGRGPRRIAPNAASGVPRRPARDRAPTGQRRPR